MVLRAKLQLLTQNAKTNRHKSLMKKGDNNHPHFKEDYNLRIGHSG